MLNAEKYKNEIFDEDIDVVYKNVKKVFCQEANNCTYINFSLPKNWGRLIKWLLSEYKEPILDEVEREYLSAVCRPYKVVTICKKTAAYNEAQWLGICVNNVYLNNYKYIHLPYFNANTMYKGMEVDKEYTPQELGITCKNNPNGEIKHD